MRVNVRVILEGTFFIGEFNDIESIRHLKIKVQAQTFIRTEHQVFSSTIEGVELHDGVLLPSPQIARANPVLHLKLTRPQGFVRADNTDEAKDRDVIHDSVQVLRVYSGTTELQGSVNLVERGLSNLFIADSNTQCILQVLVSQAVFQRSEEAESVVLVFFLGGETSFKQVKKLVAQRLVGMPLVSETYFTYKGKLVEDRSTVMGEDSLGCKLRRRLPAVSYGCVNSDVIAHSNQTPTSPRLASTPTFIIVSFPHRISNSFWLPLRHQSASCFHSDIHQLEGPVRRRPLNSKPHQMKLSAIFNYEKMSCVWKTPQRLINKQSHASTH
jgi:hypothetical protein